MIFAFEITTTSPFHVFIETFIDIWFLLEILLNFLTGYYEKGHLVMQKKKIAINYIKTWFFLDLISSIPFSFFT